MNNNIEPRRVALVTGAAQRIGEQLVRALHARGYNVILHYRSSADSASRIAGELNAQRRDSAHTVCAALEDSAALRNLVGESLSRWGRIDVLINNASSYYTTSWGEATLEDWDNLIGSNLKGPFFLTQALLPVLSETRGCVVNMIDIFAERPARDFPVYCMAKAGLAMMTKSLAFDRGQKVRVNGIAPGVILWPERPTSEAEKEETLERIPAGHIGNPDDIVRTALFLIEDAPYVNGQIIAVDGGLSLHT